MSKTPAEFARELDAEIAAHVARLREEVDPLVEAYRALAGGQVPPSITAVFGSSKIRTSERPPKPKPKPKGKPKAKRQRARPSGPTNEHKGIENKRQLIQVLTVADGPVTIRQLAERVPFGESSVRDHLRRLQGEQIVYEVAEANGPHPATFGLTARRAEWDDPEQLDVDVEDLEEEPVLPGEEPDEVVDETTAEAIAAAAAPHSPTSKEGQTQAGMSARVRKAIEREALQPAEADVDSDARPTGERLVNLVVDATDERPAKPRDVAREHVLPAPEVAQAFRVAESRGWIERQDDGTYAATGARTNGHNHMATA